jgi:hypothetical protein
LFGGIALPKYVFKNGHGLPQADILKGAAMPSFVILSGVGRSFLAQVGPAFPRVELFHLTARVIATIG